MAEETDPKAAADPQAPELPLTDPESPPDSPTETEGEDPSSAPETPQEGDDGGGPDQAAEAPPVADKARRGRGGAQAGKKAADAKRRAQAIADAPRPPDPSEADQAELERKASIREAMAKTQEDLEAHQEEVDACKARLRELAGELYPHLVKSDRHVDAVRAYVNRQRQVRATRASSPAQIKRILEQAGKAPIDAAFATQRARGMRRPERGRPAPAKTGQE